MERQKTKINGKILLTAGVFLICGVVIGWIIPLNFNSSEEIITTVRQGGGYQFINPLLECENNSGLESKNLQDFKNKIEKIIKEKIAGNITNHVSVYYRDLNNGPWFGVNEKEPFAPASLLKVPVMMAYFKIAEENPELLNEIIQYTQPTDDKTNLRPYQDYTVEYLIEEMIINSDNKAFALLVSKIEADKINQIHLDLGLSAPEQNSPEDFITVKSYASLFRVLYNASYLNRKFSEKALEILSRVEFNEGLAKGLPNNLTLANKYGITGSLENNSRQLHDCGIIYYPNHPYLLCVMSRGNNSQELADIIASISEAIYQEINTNYQQL